MPNCYQPIQNDRKLLQQTSQYEQLVNWRHKARDQSNSDDKPKEILGKVLEGKDMSTRSQEQSSQIKIRQTTKDRCTPPEQNTEVEDKVNNTRHPKSNPKMETINKRNTMQFNPGPNQSNSQPTQITRDTQSDRDGESKERQEV